MVRERQVKFIMGTVLVICLMVGISIYCGTSYDMPVLAAMGEAQEKERGDLPVTVDDVPITEEKLYKNGKNKYILQTKIANQSGALIKKAEFTYKMTNYYGTAIRYEGTTKIDVVGERLETGKEVTKKIPGPKSGKMSDVKLMEASITIQDQKVVYDYVKKTYDLIELPKDIEPPVIDFALDRTFYVGDEVDFERNIRVTDNQDPNPELSHHSDIDTSIPGKYDVTYEARDDSGNQSSIKVTFTVLREKPRNYVDATRLDEVVDQILEGIVEEEMTDEEKTRAIYKWVCNNISYVNRSEKEDWVVSAYQGLTKKNGDCFVYYATAQALLLRAEVPNMRIHSVEGKSTMHFWSLIKINGEWYHFDTTPRRGVRGTLCLLTDAQIDDFMRRRGKNYSHRRNVDQFPQVSSVAISKEDW